MKSERYLNMKSISLYLLLLAASNQVNIFATVKNRIRCDFFCFVLLFFWLISSFFVYLEKCSYRLQLYCILLFNVIFVWCFCWTEYETGNVTYQITLNHIISSLSIAFGLFYTLISMKNHLLNDKNIA